MPGGKRRALKKLLKQQQVAELPPPPAGVSADEFITFSDDDDTETPVLLSADAGGTSGTTSATSATSVSTSGTSFTTATSGTSTTTTTTSTNTANGNGANGKEDSPASSASGLGIFGGRRGGKKSSKQRFAERQARKTQAIIDAAPATDAGWNAQLEKERLDEVAVIEDACRVLGREIFEIQPDGHCMFSAVADQLGLMGVLGAEKANNPYHVRRVAAQYMREHRDDFLPFLASVDGEDMPGATDDGLMTDAQFKEYCHRVESTAEWGGEPEIQALCRAFQVPIHVIQRGPPTVVSHGGANDAFGGAMSPKESLEAGDNVVRISYHRRMYGLGEHYNSLRPVA